MIKSILQGIGVVVYLDHILITGCSKEAHPKTLDEVLSKLDKAGPRVKRSMCEFMKESVTYLGHRIDAEGLLPLPDRVRAIKDASTPDSVSKFKSYLGMLTYYSMFILNLSTILHPLYKLLRKDVDWAWGVAQAKAFAASKDLLTSDKCLTHFDAGEWNYSQLEKEGFACIFGIKKFHDYVFGPSFVLVTDHKPLLDLLKEYRATLQQMVIIFV